MKNILFAFLATILLCSCGDSTGIQATSPASLPATANTIRPLSVQANGAEQRLRLIQQGRIELEIKRDGERVHQPTSINTENKELTEI